MPTFAEATAYPLRSRLPNPQICSVRAPAGWSSEAQRSAMSPEPVIDTSAESLAQSSSAMSPDPDPASTAPAQNLERSSSARQLVNQPAPAFPTSQDVLAVPVSEQLGKAIRFRDYVEIAPM